MPATGATMWNRIKSFWKRFKPLAEKNLWFFCLYQFIYCLLCGGDGTSDRLSFSLTDWTGPLRFCFLWLGVQLQLSLVPDTSQYTRTVLQAAMEHAKPQPASDFFRCWRYRVRHNVFPVNETLVLVGVNSPSYVSVFGSKNFTSFFCPITKNCHRQNHFSGRGLGACHHAAALINRNKQAATATDMVRDQPVLFYLCHLHRYIICVHHQRHFHLQ